MRSARLAIQFASVRSARPPRMMAAALAESTCRSRRESDARKTMTRIAERQLRRLRRVRAGKFRSDLTAGDLAHPRNRSPHKYPTHSTHSMRIDEAQRVACVDPRGRCDDCDVAASARHRRGAAPRSAARRAAGAPECAPAGHSGTGHGHPHGCVPHDTSDGSGGPPRTVGEGGGRPRGSPRGEAGTWKSGILRTCEAAPRGRFSVFQDFRFSPSQAPHLPAASPGALPAAVDRPRGARKLET